MLALVPCSCLSLSFSLSFCVSKPSVGMLRLFALKELRPLSSPSSTQVLRRWDRVKFSRALSRFDPDAVGDAAAARDAGDFGTSEPKGPLAGVPFVVSDNINVAGWSTTSGSSALKSHVAKHDAAAVRSLKAAGAVVIGHATVSELALDPTGGNVVNVRRP